LRSTGAQRDDFAEFPCAVTLEPQGWAGWLYLLKPEVTTFAHDV